MKGKFSYVGVRVKDLEKSIDFYSGLLGMKVTGRVKIAETRGETVGLESEEGGFHLELNYYEKDSPYNTKYAVGEGLDHLAFKVEDIDTAIREAKKAGYRTLLEIKTKTSRWAYIEDPDGIWVEIFI
jgi:lactoylglutathione lyase